MNNTDEYVEALKRAARAVVEKVGPADMAIVLGSGLNGFTQFLSDAKTCSYSEIPGLPTTSVKGHPGKLVSGTLSEKRVYCLAGRTHAYEGFHMHQLTFMARMLFYCGVKLYVATNSSGGCQPGMQKGSVMMIRDHVNFFKRSPLLDTAGAVGVGQHHPDPRHVYSERLAQVARAVAVEQNVTLFEGVYCGMPGPTYETHAEVSMGRACGGSAFGMSTVPETVAAHAIGMEVFACALITNLAAGMTNVELTHGEVTDAASEFAPTFKALMLNFVKRVTLQSPAHGEPDLSPLPPSPDLVTLPTPEPPVATPEQVADAAAFLSSKFGHESVGRALCLGFHSDAVVQAVTITQTVPYAQVPHFTVVSASGRSGSVSLGLNGTQPVLVLHNHVLEGLSCSEAAFLSRTLAAMGVQTLVATVAAGGCSPVAVPHTSLWVRDIADWSTVRPYAFVNKAKPVLADHDASVADTVAYGHFLGPMFPTPAEVGCLERAVNCIGITSPSIVYACSSLGMRTSVAASITHRVSSHVSHYEDPVTTVPADNAIHAELAQMVCSRLAHAVCAHPKADSAIHQRLSYDLRQPVHQGDVEAIGTCVQRLQAAVASVQPLIEGGIARAILCSPNFPLEAAIGVDPAKPQHSPVLGTCVWQGSASDMGFPARFADDTSEPALCRLWRSPLAPTTYLTLQTSYDAYHGYPHSTMVFPMRVIQELAPSIRHVTLLGEAQVADESVASLGSIVTLRDHVNISGRNPLFGINNDSWGVRFPSASDTYTPDFLDRLSLPKLVAGYVASPPSLSRADAALALSLGCHALTHQVIPEAIVARHARMCLTTLAVVTSVGSGSDSVSVSQAHGSACLDAISALMSVE